MIRIILVYGLISGTIVIAGILATFLLPHPHASVWLGYLIMLVALSAILMGVKQYRDTELGGVIKFRSALILGLGIAMVASLAYVAIWEAYLAVTGYRFIGQFIEATLAAKRAAGITGATYQQAVAQMEAFRQEYANPLYRMGTTFMEIFPVGLLIALVSAALLRNPGFLPARARVN
ncbi:MAG TPA: DUF4199 domain-containing protein [Rhizomicrobium sp.]|jgi:hypothetical protein